MPERHLRKPSGAGRYIHMPATWTAIVTAYVLAGDVLCYSDCIKLSALVGS